MQRDVTPAPAPDPATFTLTRASVDVRSTCTQYLRAGSGAPVLLIGARAFDAAATDPLVPLLSRRFRVIVPQLQGGGAPAPCDATPATGFATWLREFLDGLGVLHANVVAQEEFALRALSFCLTDPLRVRRLVLLYQDGADPAVRATATPEPFGPTQHPLLLWRQGLQGGENDRSAVEVIERFLLGEPAIDEG